MKDCIVRAFRAGELLTKAKDGVPHGTWAVWLERNCKLPERTAQRYMRMHTKRGEIEAKMKSANVADITIRQAELLIAPASKSSAAKSAPAVIGAEPKQFGGNDVESVVQTAEDKHLKALQDLKRTDHVKAKAVANAFVKRLQEIELL
jgi:Protein of unknown function (DUF3102)